MENKDLNKLFKEGTDDGNGIPFKDAYWEKMNTLLDEQMPVSTTPASQSSIPTGSVKWFRFFQVLSAALVATIVLLITFYPNTSKVSIPAGTYSSSDAPAVPSGASRELLTDRERTSTQLKSAEQEMPSPETGENSLAGETKEKQDFIEPLKREKTIPASNTTNAQTFINGQKRAGSSAPKQNKDISNDLSFIHTPEGSISSASKQPEDIFLSSREISNTKQESTVSGNNLIQYQSGKEVIELMPNKLLYIPGKETERPYHHPDFISYKGQHSLIRQLIISPYVSLVHSTKEQAYNIDNILYQNKPQTNLAYGINVNITTKQFAIRTGIGISQSRIHTITQTTNDIYRSDTTYKIINPNYDTTHTGTNIALIQRQIDSTLISRNTQTSNSAFQYQYLTIPLTLQYRFAQKRVSFMAEAGALNHFMVSSGLQSAADKHFRIPAYQVQLTLGSGAFYALNSTCEIGAQYNYAFNPQSSKLLLLNNNHIFTLLFNYRLW